ncbi:MAG: hypothetical protein Q9162_006354 [Coniocarpon cinnabarinum]
MNTANGIYSAPPNGINPSFDQNGAHGPYGQSFSAPTASPGTFDFTSQFPNHSGQRFPDGLTNNTSPSIHQSPFQVPSVIPQKRARDDQVGASPHPPQTNLGLSRSQTPSQPPFNQYGTQAPPPNFQTPTPFQHLQASNHATPSPNPSSQQFRPPTSQPAMSSPPNFPNQHPQAGPFASMANSMNRMSTPQNASNHFMSSMPPGASMPPGLSGGMGAAGPQMPGQMPMMRGQMPMQNMSPQQQEMYKQYQQQMMARQHQMRNMGQMPQGAQVNGMTPPQRAAMAGGMGGNMAGKMAIPPGADRATPQMQAMQFMSQLQAFLHSQGQQLEPNPTVCGNSIHYFQLFQLFVRLKPLQNPQAWPIMMQQLRIPPPQQNQAIQELRGLYERNLMAFGRHYASMVEKQKQIQQGRMPGQGSPTSEQGPRPPVPPGFPPQPAQAQASSASSPAAKNRVRTNSSAAPDGLDRNTPSKAPSVTGQTSSPHQFPQGSPVPLKISQLDEDDDQAQAEGVKSKKSSVQAQDPRTLFDPEYKPRRYNMDTHGGLALDALAEHGGILYDYKTFQRFEELGPVDLPALTMSLQSGIHEEIASALDQLAALSQRPLYLGECLDLVDILLEIGREQLQRLSDGTEPSANLQIMPMEDLVRSCRADSLDFRKDRPFGTPGYDKRHATDRLLAVTTIFRNLSFPFMERHNYERESEHNRHILASPDMQSFYAKAIRLLNESTSPLESNHDHLEIMKDVVVFLSNVSETMIITGEDDARAFLVFLLAFAPKTIRVSGRKNYSFTTYEPLKHQYLPNAIDSLAKMLARDEPNRGMIKTILHNDLSVVSDSSRALFTKAFATGIAPIPDKSFNTTSSGGPLRLVERRKPFITQAMLILDILSTLVPATLGPPGPDETSGSASLQRQWLESEDAWASRIIHLVIAMGMHDAHHPHMERHPVTRERVDTGQGFTSITQRAIGMVRRLLESADKIDTDAGKDGGDLISAKVLGTLPLDDMTFAAIMLPRFDPEVIRGLTALSQMVS